MVFTVGVENDNLKFVKWTIPLKKKIKSAKKFYFTELNRQNGERDEKQFQLTRFTNYTSHYSLSWSHVHVEFNQDFKGKIELDIKLCLQEVKSSIDDSTSRTDHSETIPDYHRSPCEVWVFANSEKYFLKKSSDSNCWKSEFFHLDIQDSMNSSSIFLEIWIKFNPFDVREMSAHQNLADYLFVEQTNCDVKFCFDDGRQIGGHKRILSARSPVFAAMFKHDMQEAKTGKVSIKDFDLETFRELLHFIYLGRTSGPLDASKAQPLFLAADKYDILDLREDCSRKLLSSMQLCNAIELMIWAHNNSVDHVKEAALEVVVRNGKEICLQQDWEMLTIIHPELCPLATRRMMEIAQFPAVKRKASN
jgi:hypothetical protein